MIIILINKIGNSYSYNNYNIYIDVYIQSYNI